MNPIPRSIHDRRVFPAALIVAIAALAILGSHSFAQSKPAADSDAIPHLPYGVSRQESGQARVPEFTPPPGVTELPAESKSPPANRAKPEAKTVPAGPPSAVPPATPKPHDPLWDLPDAKGVGGESAEALGRKYHLPAQPHGLNHVSPIGWLSVLGLLAMGAVAIVLGQRSGRERDRKSRRSSRRAAP